MKRSLAFMALLGSLATGLTTHEAMAYGGVVVAAPAYSYYAYPYPYPYYAYPAYTYAPQPEPYAAYTYSQPQPYATSADTCHEYSRTAIIAGRPQQLIGTACQQPDGRWKIMD